MKNGVETFILRQVDDIAVAAHSESVASRIIADIGSFMKSPIKSEGLITLFNGLNVTQTKDYIKISPESYLQRVMKRHNWMKNFPTTNQPQAMKSDPDYLKDLDSDSAKDALEIDQFEKEFGFKYRAATGEIIFAMVTARPDISFPSIKLSQYNNNPGRKHFEAVRNLLLYLRDTCKEGLYFWREHQNKILPQGPIPHIHQDPYERVEMKEESIPFQAIGVCDSDWAGDTKHRRSVSGIGCLFAGAAVVYKSNFQRAVSLSSTEAEFYALCDTGKILLYIRSILEELGIEQEKATPVYEDNQGCLLMVNSGQPTKRVRHVDTRQFAILDWVQTDLLEVKRVASSDNAADTLTKPLGKVLSSRHNDVLMGRARPAYNRYAFQ